MELRKESPLRGALDAVHLIITGGDVIRHATLIYGPKGRKWQECERECGMEEYRNDDVHWANGHGENEYAYVRHPGSSDHVDAGVVSKRYVANSQADHPNGAGPNRRTGNCPILLHVVVGFMGWEVVVVWGGFQYYADSNNPHRSYAISDGNDRIIFLPKTSPNTGRRRPPSYCSGFRITSYSSRQDQYVATAAPLVPFCRC